VASQRDVRQLLSDKVSGDLVGLWHLIPEDLRLGIGDLLCGVFMNGYVSQRVDVFS